MTETRVPFNTPHLVGTESAYLREALADRHLSGDGPFTRRCHAWLVEHTGAPKALLTHSCTGALEMAGLLADLRPGDEVIMPSFTFVSTANAFVLRGAVPVFVDIRSDTLNVDERRVEEAVTPRTRAIVPVHYAGVGCDMDALMSIADRRGLMVIEDAAQGLCAAYRGRPLGAIGHLGALSFHATKVVVCGEGGAILVNDPRWGERAEIIREKGTNRSQFIRGAVDKYTWVDLGSSYLPSEIGAAFLLAQLEGADAIVRERLRIWTLYHEGLRDLETTERLRRPVVPPDCRHNGQSYFVLIPDADRRPAVLRRLAERGIQATFHYVPLHSSPAGRRFGRSQGALTVTEDASARLIRLPLWVGMTDTMIGQVVEAVVSAC